MIAKGTTHNNGAKLAQYMATGKDGERAVVWRLRGFEAANITDAFRDVQIMAGGGKCRQPFFHLQVRNRDGETLTREQWELAANRIERMLGLAGQPRAIAFHTNEATGHEHMHVAWSRIDQDTLKARPLPFFKRRLKTISRELELHFGLEPVTNRREGPIKYAPTRAQEEQARRLGVDIHAVRNAIRECWDHSDCGRGFEAALAEKGLRLARGEKRDFIVIDRAGGMHALGKRILGVSAAQVREGMSDLGPDHLPGVEQARGSIRDAARERPTKKRAASWDRDRANAAWDDAIIAAAIEKEKRERLHIDPDKRRAEQAGPAQEKKWPIMPPTPEPIRTSPRYHIEDTGREVTRREPSPAMPEELKGASRHIWKAYHGSRNPQDFIAALDKHKIVLAAVTKDEAGRSHRLSAFARQIGNFAPSYREGEIVAVTERGRVYQLNRRTTGEERADIEKFLKPLDRTSLQGIEATRETLRARVEQRDIEVGAFRELLRDTRAAQRLKLAQKPGRPGRIAAPKATRLPAGAPLRAAGKTLDFVGKAIGNLFAPQLTPEQIRDGERARLKRDAEGERSIDLARFADGLAQEQRNRDQQREAERRQHRDRGGDDRER